MNNKKGRGRWRSFTWRLIPASMFGGVLGIGLYTAGVMARLELKEMNASLFVQSKANVCSNISGFGPEMIRVNGQIYQMGSEEGFGDSDEHPVHAVTLHSFAISPCEVTFDEYDHFANETGRALPRDEGWGRGRRPVINVSWEDAQAYSAWLSKQTGRNYRLPTEAEWEFSARAGSATHYWWGEEIMKERANCHGCGSQWDGKQTAPVGSFGPNGFGLYDTAGNVWEWLEDCWHSSYEGAPRDGSAWLETDGGDCVRRVIRGGSWSSLPRNMRSSARTKNYRAYRNFTIGFRLAQDLE